MLILGGFNQWLQDMLQTESGFAVLKNFLSSVTVSDNL